MYANTVSVMLPLAPYALELVVRSMSVSYALRCALED